MLSLAGPGHNTKVASPAETCQRTLQRPKETADTGVHSLLQPDIITSTATHNTRVHRPHQHNNSNCFLALGPVTVALSSAHHHGAATRHPRHTHT